MSQEKKQKKGEKQEEEKEKKASVEMAAILFSKLSYDEAQKLAINLQKMGYLRKETRTVDVGLRKLVQSFLPGQPGYLPGEKPASIYEPEFSCDRVTYKGKNCSRAFRYVDEKNGRMQDCSEYCLQNCDKWINDLVGKFPKHVNIALSAFSDPVNIPILKGVVQLKRPILKKDPGHNYDSETTVLVYDDIVKSWFVQTGGPTVRDRLEDAGPLGQIRRLLIFAEQGSTEWEAKLIQEGYENEGYHKIDQKEAGQVLETYCANIKKSGFVGRRPRVDDVRADIHLFIQRPIKWSAKTKPSKLTISSFSPADRYYQPNSKWRIAGVEYLEEEPAREPQFYSTNNFYELRLNHNPMHRSDFSELEEEVDPYEARETLYT